MASRSQRISPLQVIFGAFPDAVRYVGGHMTRVRDVSNPDGDRRDQLSARVRQGLARRITAELDRRQVHEGLRQERFTARRVGGGQAAPEGEIDLVLPALFDEGAPEPGTVPAARGARPATPPVRASEISLIEVTDDAIVRTRVFPRSVQCQRCGHFLLLDAERPPATLNCPCCREGQLVIEPIVFICGRCAAVRELLPPGERMGAGRSRRRRRHDENLGVPPRCPECETGHTTWTSMARMP